MNERDKKIISDFKEKFSQDILKHVRRIIIFGSRARGTTAEDSDLDILVLVDEKTAAIEKGLEDAAYQVMWDYDFKPMISLKVFSEARFNHAVSQGFSFYQNVEREGIPV